MEEVVGGRPGQPARDQSARQSKDRPLVLDDGLAEQLLRAQAENIAQPAERGRPQQRRQRVDRQEAQHADAGEPGGDAADHAHAVGIAVEEHEAVGIAQHQPVGMAEAGSLLQPEHPWVLGEPAPDEEQDGIAQEGAEEGDGEGLPGDEHPLMGEEPGQDRGRLALGHAAQKHRDQSVFGDQEVDGLRHSVAAPPATRASILASCSAIRSNRSL